MGKVLNLTTGTSGGGGSSPAYPYNIKDLRGRGSDGSAELTWKDPEDDAWTGTKLRRKLGEFPMDENDGSLVVDSTVRDQYSTTPIIDTGLTNDVMYNYQAFPYAGVGYCNNEINRISIMPMAYVEFGVRHMWTASSPLLTRLGMAVDKTATAGIGDVPQQSDFDTMPIYKDIRVCNVAIDGTVTAYEGEPAFTRDGSNGEVMVEIPAFWYKITHDATQEEWWIASAPLEGYAKHPAFDRPAPYNDLDKIYISAYELASDYSSKAGSAQRLSATRGTGRSSIRNKGTGWFQLDYATHLAVNLLMYVEYATLNMRSAIGAGRTSGGVVLPGNTDAMAGHTGRPEGTASTVSIKYRNIEGWWNNINTFIDGLILSSGKYYWCLDPTSFADTVTSAYTEGGSIPTSYSSDTYIQYASFLAAQPWLRAPSSAGGTGTGAALYYCAGCRSASGVCTAVVSGVKDTYAGPAYLDLSRAATYNNTNVGFRSMYLPPKA